MAMCGSDKRAVRAIDLDLAVIDTLMGDRYARLKNVLWANDILYSAFVGSLRAVIEAELDEDLVVLLMDIRKQLDEMEEVDED